MHAHHAEPRQGQKRVEEGKDEAGAGARMAMLAGSLLAVDSFIERRRSFPLSLFRGINSSSRAYAVTSTSI